MARLVIESVTKAGTWRLTLYICITFCGYAALGAVFGGTDDVILNLIGGETAIMALGGTGLLRYLGAFALAITGTLVLVVASYLLSLLLERDAEWTDAQLSDLLLGTVPVALSLPISGFVLWVMATVFPGAGLKGFATVGLVTALGGCLLLAYLLVTAYSSVVRRRRT